MIVICFCPSPDQVSAQDSTLSISGSVHYAQNDLPVDSVKMRLYDGTYKRTFTDHNGRYSIVGIPPGIFYTVAPGRGIKDDSPVTAFDASLILRYLSNQLELDNFQIHAADVTKNGDVSAFDASIILKYITIEDPQYFITDFENIGTWSFIPDRMYYDSLLTDQNDQDYIGYIYGDVSGNWREQTLSQDTVYVWFLTNPAEPGKILNALIVLSGVQGLNIYSGQCAITYDENMMTFSSVEGVEFGALTHSVDRGKVSLVWANTDPMEESGSFLRIYFFVSPDAQAGQSYPLRFEYFMLNEGNPSSITTDGLIPIITIPDISVSETDHDFGEVVVSETVDWGLTVSNEGTGVLSIFNITVDNSVFTVDRTAFTLQAGMSQEVTVSCSPAAIGSTFGQVIIYSNDGDEPLMTVSVRAVGVERKATLRIGDGYGTPGSSDNRVLIYLDNEIDVKGLEMVINYDPDILRASKVTSTPRSAHMDLFDADVTSIPGRMKLLVADLRTESIIAGTGSVAKVYFDVLSNVSLGTYALRAAEVILADVRHHSVPVKIEHGHFYVEPRYSLSGGVTYCGGSHPLPGVDIQLSGDATETVQTDSLGEYNFSSLQPDGEFCIRISPPAIPDRVISCFDASIVLRHLLSTCVLTACESWAADITGDGSISTFDAAVIMRYVTCMKAGIQDSPYLFYQTGTWKTMPDSLCFEALTSSKLNQMFNVTVIGDVSLSWPGEMDTLTQPQITASLDRVNASPGGSCRMFLTVSPIHSEYPEAVHLYSLEARIEYDPSVMILTEVGNEGLATQDFGLFMYNTVEPEGVLSVGLSRWEMLTCSGDDTIPIVYFRFEVDETVRSGDSSVVSIRDLMFNEGFPRTRTVNGIIRIIESTGIQEDGLTVPTPDEYVLFQNYPNPFNSYTDIRYQIVDSGSPVHTTLKIYNVLGQEVRTVVDEYQDAGCYSITWDGMDNTGDTVPSGIYFYRLSVNSGRWTQLKKSLLLK